MRKGIDVAKWNGTIDWSKVKAEGIDFAILKITKKDNEIEAAFERNYSGAQAAGVSVGGYRYVYAKSVAAAQAEANALVKVLNGRKMQERIYLDMEDSSIKGCGKAALTQIINTEAEILKAAGYEVGIYCNTDWANNVLDYATLCKSYPFWLARYGTNTGTLDLNSKYNPQNYENCIGWQYSSKGRVAGISGDVDMDVMYEDSVDNAATPNPVADVHIQLNYKPGNSYTVICGKLYVRTKPTEVNGVVNKGRKIRAIYRNAVVKNGATMRIGADGQIWMYIGLKNGVEEWVCADHGDEMYLA